MEYSKNSISNASQMELSYYRYNDFSHQSYVYPFQSHPQQVCDHRDPTWCNSDPTRCNWDPTWCHQDPTWCNQDPTWCNWDPTWCNWDPTQCNWDPTWSSFKQRQCKKPTAGMDESPAAGKPSRRNSPLVQISPVERRNSNDGTHHLNNGHRNNAENNFYLRSSDKDNKSHVQQARLYGPPTNSLEDIVQTAAQKRRLTNPAFWKKYGDIQTMSVQTDKDAVIEILQNFASARKKQVFLFQRLKASILRNLKLYDASDLSTICHSFVILGFLHTDFVVSISPRIVSTAHRCPPSQLTQLLDAYASVRYHVPECVAAITEETLNKLSEFGFSDLTTHLSSFARLNIHHHRLFRMAAERLLMLEAELCALPELTTEISTDGSTTARITHPIQHCTEMGTVISVDGPCGEPSIQSAIASEGETEGCGGSAKRSRSKTSSLDWDDEEIQMKDPTTLRRSTEGTHRPPCFSARDLTLAAYSFAKLGFRFPSVFHLVSWHAKRVIRDFTAHQIQMVVVAFQRANIRDVDLFTAMSSQAQRRMAQFKAESLALLLRSFSLLDIRDDGLLTRVITQLPRLLLTFGPLDVSTTLNAFARLNVCSPALMGITIPHILLHQHTFESSELQSIFHACAKLGYCDPEFLSLFYSRCDLSRLSPGQLVLVTCDLLKVGYKDLGFLRRLEKTLSLNFKFFSISVMAQILSALLSLELYLNLEFVSLMQFLAREVRTAWAGFVSKASSQSSCQHNSTKLSSCQQISPATLVALCLSELSVISHFSDLVRFSFSSSSPPFSLSAPSVRENVDDPVLAVPEGVRRLLPICPVALLHQLVTMNRAIKETEAKITALETGQHRGVNEHDEYSSNHSMRDGAHGQNGLQRGSSAMLLVVGINLIRAAVQSLPGFNVTEVIQDEIDWTHTMRHQSSAGCLYGILHLAHVEQDTESAIQDIALVLSKFGGLNRVTVHRPLPEDACDAAQKDSTAVLAPRLSVPITVGHCARVVGWEHRPYGAGNTENQPGTEQPLFASPTQSHHVHRTLPATRPQGNKPIKVTPRDGRWTSSGDDQLSERATLTDASLRDDASTWMRTATWSTTERLDARGVEPTTPVALEQEQSGPHDHRSDVPWHHGNTTTRNSRCCSDVSNVNTTHAHAVANVKMSPSYHHAIPYHSYLTIPQDDLYLLRRWTIPSRDFLHQKLTRLPSDLATTPDHHHHPFHHPSVLYPAEKADGCCEDRLPWADLLHCRQRSRSQSDSGVYGVEDVDEDLDDDDEDNLRSCVVLREAQYDCCRQQLVAEAEESLRATTPNEISQEIAKKDEALILWGGPLHYWHHADQHRVNILETQSNSSRRSSSLVSRAQNSVFDPHTTETDDATDADHEYLSDEDVIEEVERGLQAHRQYVDKLTSMARLQLRIFTTLLSPKTQIFVIPDFIWNSLTVIESRRSFLASLLLDESHSVGARNFNLTPCRYCID